MHQYFLFVPSSEFVEETSFMQKCYYCFITEDFCSSKEYFAQGLLVRSVLMKSNPNFRFCLTFPQICPTVSTESNSVYAANIERLMISFLRWFCLFYITVICVINNQFKNSLKIIRFCVTRKSSLDLSIEVAKIWYSTWQYWFCRHINYRNLLSSGNKIRWFCGLKMRKQPWREQHGNDFSGRRFHLRNEDDFGVLSFWLVFEIGGIRMLNRQAS